MFFIKKKSRTSFMHECLPYEQLYKLLSLKVKVKLCSEIKRQKGYQYFCLMFQIRVKLIIIKNTEVLQRGRINW